MLRVDLSAPLITIEDVVKLRDERDRLSEQLDKLTAERDVLDAKLQGIRPWLPADLSEQIFNPGSIKQGDTLASKSDEPEPDTFYARWERAILPMLEAKGHGLTTAMIRKEVAGQPMEDEIGFQGRILHRAISRMVTVGRLIREDDFYMLPGQSKPDYIPPSSAGELMSRAVLQFLSDKDAAYTGRELSDALGETEVGGVVREKQTYFFTVLSKLVSEHKLIKEGRTYRAPSKENEPSSGGTLNGSDTDSAKDIFG